MHSEMKLCDLELNHGEYILLSDSICMSVCLSVDLSANYNLVPSYLYKVQFSYLVSNWNIL